MAATPVSNEVLFSGSIEIKGRMPWSSNGTFLVALTLGEKSGRAIYKPGALERPLWDYPDGLYRREVAAYELSSACGFDFVPKTIVRSDGPFGEGSLQAFVDADFAEHYFTIVEHDRFLPALKNIAGFDLLANSGDRKGGHVLLGPDDHLYAIDNGLCLHAEDRLRTVMWDFIDEPIPGAVLEGCAELLQGIPEVLVPLLSVSEQEALTDRAERMLRFRRFPAPEPGSRAYPWPLV